MIYFLLLLNAVIYWMLWKAEKLLKSDKYDFWGESLMAIAAILCSAEVLFGLVILAQFAFRDPNVPQIRWW